MREPKCTCGECKYCNSRKEYLANKDKIISRSTIWARRNSERHNKSVADWKKNNPDKVKSYWKKRNDRVRGTQLSSDINRRCDLKRNYETTLEWFDAKLKEQGGGCGICGCLENNATNRRFYVDHSHSTDHNRGLLCHRCNTALERLESIEEWAAKAQTYLDRYELEWQKLMESKYGKV